MARVDRWGVLVLGIVILALSLPYFFAPGTMTARGFPRLGGRLDLADILRHTPDGTPPRQEMEYKFLVEGPPEILRNNAYLLDLMRREIEVALLNDLAWEAPPLVNGTYTICPIGMGTFCFLDVYFDTPDGLNEKWNIAHRVRYRWHSRGGFIRYMLGEETTETFPHRCEYQLKAYRRERTEGFYVSNEARFEYRNESFPFKRDRSAPPPPWPFEEFLPVAATGRYRQYHTWFSYEYARYLAEVEPALTAVELDPVLVEVQTRRRIHLELPTAWGVAAGAQGMGSTTNTTQAMVITLDTVEVFRPEILQVYFLSRAARQQGGLPKRLQRRLREEFRPVGGFTSSVPVRFRLPARG